MNNLNNYERMALAKKHQIKSQAQRIAELDHSIELWTLAGQNWERQKGELEAALNEQTTLARNWETAAIANRDTAMGYQDKMWECKQANAKLEAALAERTKERDEFDAKLRAVEAAIAEVHPAWLDAEDYADAIRRVGQERDQFAAALIEAHNAIEQCRDTEDCPDCGDYMAGCELDPKAILSARLAAERKTMQMEYDTFKAEMSVMSADILAAERKAGAYAALTEARRRLCAEWGFVQCADSILDLRAEIESGEVKV